MIGAPLGVLLGVGFGLVLGTVVASVTAIVGFARGDDVNPPLSGESGVGVTLFLTGAIAVLFGILLPSVGNGWGDSLSDPSRAVANWTAAVIEFLPLVVLGGVTTIVLGRYGYRQGERIAGDVPASETDRHNSRETLSPATVADADDTGRVGIDVTLDTASFESQHSLLAAKWDATDSRTWELQADLPIQELEARLADRFETRFDVDVTQATIDSQGQATVSAAPSPRTGANQLSAGQRAVTLDTLVPAGLEVGDQVVLRVTGGGVDGTVLGIQSTQSTKRDSITSSGRPGDDAAGAFRASGDETHSSVSPADRTIDHADSRLSVAVAVDDVETVLTAETVDVFVRSQGGNQARGAFRQLRRTGVIVRHVTIDEQNQDLLENEAPNVEILARRMPDAGDEWEFRSVKHSDHPDEPIEDRSREGDESHFPEEPAKSPKSDVCAAENPIEQAVPRGTDVLLIGNERTLAQFTPHEPTQSSAVER